MLLVISSLCGKWQVASGTSESLAQSSDLATWGKKKKKYAAEISAFFVQLGGVI